MSIETIGWAKLQRCGDVTTKAVLVELANWSRADGICQFRSVPDIATVVETSDRSVQRALKKLETPCTDGGLGLIRRVLRRRSDGGQASNCFELVGYIYPGDKLSPTPGDSVTPGGDNLSPGPRQVVTGPGVNLSPQIKTLDLELNKPPNPLGRGREGVAMVDDWVLPGIETLPPAIGALAAQWPAGAYQAEGAAFHQHWLGRGTRRQDWAAFWAARVKAQHIEVMRAAKAGVSFGADPGRAPVALAVAVRAKSREDGQSAGLHDALREGAGKAMWERWFAPVALIFDDCGLTVVAPGAFHRSHLEAHHGETIRAALGSMGRGVDWMRFEVERADGGAGRAAGQRSGKGKSTAGARS